MGTLADIQSPVWGISTIGYGVIVEGLATIRQRIDIVLRTTKGTDPLRELFGSNVYKYVDAPIDIAIPNIKNEIREALSIWMPEIVVTKITSSFGIDTSNPIFSVTYKLVDQDIIDQINFGVLDGVTTIDSINEVILQAYFPPNPNNYRYQITLQENGALINPLPSPGGFDSIALLYNWASTQWAYIGKWNLLSDRIVCYVNSTGITSASLSISVLPVVQFGAIFPALGFNQTFIVTFNANGTPAVPPMPTTFDSPGDVLFFAQTNWSNYGQWLIEYNDGTGNTVFSDEFSEEFDTSIAGYQLIGISNDPTFVADLTITTT